MTSRYRRNPSSLADLGQSWVALSTPRGGQAATALTSFLRGRTPSTQRMYQYAVLDLWHWLTPRRSRVVLPDDVRDEDARAYVDHLRSRRDGGLAGKLADLGRDRDLRLYRYCADHPNASAHELARALGLYESELLHFYVELGQLVRQHVLRRTPTLDELRARPEYSRLDVEIDPSVFRYSAYTQPATTVRTVLARVHALSSFWHELKLSGSASANPWAAVLRVLAAEAARERTAPRRVPPALAQQLWDAAGSDTLQALRDRALIALLASGVRVQDLVRLQRSDWQGDRIVLGGELPPVPLAITARSALDAFSRKLGELERDRAKRMQDLWGALEPDAPLVPAIGHWGAHAQREPLRPMKGYAVTQALHALAEQAGLKRGSPEFRSVHAQAWVGVALPAAQGVAA